MIIASNYNELADVDFSLWDLVATPVEDTAGCWVALSIDGPLPSVAELVEELSCKVFGIGSADYCHRDGWAGRHSYRSDGRIEIWP